MKSFVQTKRCTDVHVNPWFKRCTKRHAVDVDVGNNQWTKPVSSRLGQSIIYIYIYLNYLNLDSDAFKIFNYGVWTEKYKIRKNIKKIRAQLILAYLLLVTLVFIELYGERIMHYIITIKIWMQWYS